MPADTTDSTTHNLLTDSLITFARQYEGTRYAYGGNSPAGFDCSGFTCYVYQHFDIELPHGSAGQAILGEEVSLKKAQPGDLVFFSGRKVSRHHVGHVGIVSRVEDGIVWFTHASVHGVKTEPVQGNAYYEKRYICTRRISALHQSND
ncbi:MAG: C40 family peptidase [Flavobacteriales bacterium]|nr:C40 family peptidase [Flavobacteriales bacterium]